MNEPIMNTQTITTTTIKQQNSQQPLLGQRQLLGSGDGQVPPHPRQPNLTLWPQDAGCVQGDGMQVLAVFISDICSCKSKEAKIKRINKELANIISRFKG